jgi:hypothetical protein
MKFTTTICGKTFKYETPADLVEQIKPHMDKAEADYKAGEAKAKDAYKKAMEDADKSRKIYYVFRKAIEQLSPNAPATEKTAKPTAGSESN